MGEEQAAKSNFAGLWQFDHAENFDEYLRENGANWMARKMAGMSKPNLDITHDGDKFCIKLITMMFTREENFTIGVEFEKEQHSGDTMKVMPSWDGDKVVLQYTPKVEGSGKPQKVTREIQDGKLVTTMEVGNVVAKRVFKRPA